MLAILLAFWLYRGFKKKYEASRGLIAFLFGLRFLTLFLIGFLCLVPFVKLMTSSLELPIVAIRLDNYMSIKRQDSSQRQLVTSMVEQLSSYDDQIQVVPYLFGEEITDGEWNMEDKSTNIYDWVRFVNNQYRHDNLGAVLTSTDGIYTSGGDPMYAQYQLSAPFYAIGLGDTQEVIDVQISHVYHNEIAHKGNEFPIKVGVKAKNCQGANAKVQLLYNGKILEEREVKILEDDFYQEVNFFDEADKSGVRRYDIKISPLENEISIENNSQPFYVEVVESEKNILIAYEASHPDINAITNAIGENPNYTIDRWNMKDKAAKVKDLSAYHLIILHNLPLNRDPRVKKLQEQNASFLYVFDANVNERLINEQQQTFSLKIKSNQENEVSGTVNEDFTSFGIDKAGLKQLSNYPPLQAAFATLTFAQSYDALLYQKIGAVATKFPLLASSQKGQQKVGVIPATGIWKWFLYQNTRENADKPLTELFQQYIQYLCIKDDKRRLKLQKNNYLFDETEDVQFSASFYDKNYKPAKEANLQMTVVDSEQKEYQYSFIERGDLYKMNVGQLNPGEYKYKVSARLGDEIHTLNGNFTVKELNLEFKQPVARHQSLHHLASEHNGRLVNTQQLDGLVEELISSETMKPIRHEKAEITELIHNKWFFALLLLMLTTEWILRKFKGAN